MEKTSISVIILNRKGAALNDLLLLEWNVKAHTISVISQYVDAGHLVHNIAEVPNSSGLAFLFRASDVLLMDFRGLQDSLERFTLCNRRADLYGRFL